MDQAVLVVPFFNGEAMGTIPCWNCAGLPIKSSRCEPYDSDFFHEEGRNHFVKT